MLCAMLAVEMEVVELVSVDIATLWRRRWWVNNDRKQRRRLRCAQLEDQPS